MPATTAQVHISKPGERLDRDLIERHAIPDFSKHLSDIAVREALAISSSSAVTGGLSYRCMEAGKNSAKGWFTEF